MGLAHSKLPTCRYLLFCPPCPGEACAFEVVKVLVFMVFPPPAQVGLALSKLLKCWYLWCSPPLPRWGLRFRSYPSPSKLIKKLPFIVFSPLLLRFRSCQSVAIHCVLRSTCSPPRPGGAHAFEVTKVLLFIRSPLLPRFRLRPRNYQSVVVYRVLLTRLGSFFRSCQSVAAILTK